MSSIQKLQAETGNQINENDQMLNAMSLLEYYGLCHKIILLYKI